MTSSFGENTLLGGSTIIGRIRVLDVYHGHAVFPRITLRLGVDLHEQPKNEFSEGRPVTGFEIRDLQGELRLEENTRAVGVLEWVGHRRPVRSLPYQSENHVEVVCDVDWARIETIEEHRAGGEAVLWVALWPALYDSEGYIHCDIRPFKVHVPRHRWIEYLKQLTGLQRTLIEIMTPSLASPEFSASLGHLRDAQEKIHQGNFDEAVVCCRRAIESLFSSLSLPNDTNRLIPKMQDITDERRAKAYAGIISKLKECGNVTVHRDEAPNLYSRPEAQFVVAITAQMLGLVTNLFR